MVSAIESVTLGVREIEPLVAWCRDRLRLSVLRDTRASVGLLAAWGRPVHETARLVELGAPGQHSGILRLAHYESESVQLPRAALQVGPHRVCVSSQHLERVEEDGAPGLPLLAIPRPVPTLTVVTADLEASRHFYNAVFGWQPIEIPASADLVFERREAQPDSLCAFASPGHPEVDVLLGLFAAATRNAGASAPGQCGINLCTCRCDDLDVVDQRLAAVGMQPLTRPAHVGLPAGRPGRVMLVRGPADELFELVELAS